MEENKLKTIESELEAPADFTSPDVLYRDLVASIRKYHPSDDLSMIEKAYQLADNAHKDQKRKSGEPYIIHPLCAERLFLFAFSVACLTAYSDISSPVTSLAPAIPALRANVPMCALSRKRSFRR